MPTALRYINGGTDMIKFVRLMQCVAKIHIELFVDLLRHEVLRELIHRAGEEFWVWCAEGLSQGLVVGSWLYFSIGRFKVDREWHDRDLMRDHGVAPCPHRCHRRVQLPVYLRLALERRTQRVNG